MELQTPTKAELAKLRERITKALDRTDDLADGVKPWAVSDNDNAGVALCDLQDKLQTAYVALLEAQDAAEQLAEALGHEEE